MIVGVIECKAPYTERYYIVRSAQGKRLGDFRKTRSRRYKGFVFVPSGILMTAIELREVAEQLDDLNRAEQ